MRRAALASAGLHIALLAWLIHGLAQAGGAPMLGNGGGASFEVVMLASVAGGSPPETSAEAEAVATAPPPAPKPGPEAERYLAAAAAAKATAEAEAAIAAAPPPPPPPPPQAAAAAPQPAPELLPEAIEGPPVPLDEEALVPPTAALAPPEPVPERLVPTEPPMEEPLAELETEAEILAEREPIPADETLPEAPAAEAPAPVELEMPLPEQLAVLKPAPVEVPPAEAQLEAPVEEAAEEPVEMAVEQAVEAVETVVAPPLKPLKEVTLPEPPKQAAKQPAKQAERSADQQKAEAAPAEAGASDTELASLPSPGTNAAADSGSRSPGSPGAPQVGLSPGALQDYGQLLVAWLDRHKRYPDQARKRRQEAVVTVEIVVDGNGRLLSHRLIDASGIAALDAEANALPARASPFPKPPGGGQYAFQVPIVFMLR